MPAPRCIRVSPGAPPLSPGYQILLFQEVCCFRMLVVMWVLARFFSFLACHFSMTFFFLQRSVFSLVCCAILNCFLLLIFRKKGSKKEKEKHGLVASRIYHNWGSNSKLGCALNDTQPTVSHWPWHDALFYTFARF